MLSASCNSNVPNFTSPPQLLTKTIPLSIDNPYKETTQNHDPLIDVGVGNGTPIPLLFDTGSTGLHVFLSALDANHSGFTSASPEKRIVQSYGSGDRICTYYGYSAASDIHIGGVDLGEQIFDVITSTSNKCGPAFKSLLGVFGVRPGPADPSDDPRVVSLMPAFPGNLGSGFVVSLYAQPPTVTVGLTDQIRDHFSMYPVQGALSNTNWGSTEFPWCYAVVPPEGTFSAFNACTKMTLSDTGGEDASIVFPTSPPSTVADASSTPFPTDLLATFPLGTQITATLGPIDWVLPPEGSCDAYNVTNFYFDPTPASITYVSTNGVNPYFDNDVLYDFSTPRLGFHQVSPIVPKFCGSGS